jgi:hypothetical protein
MGDPELIPARWALSLTRASFVDITGICERLRAAMAMPSPRAQALRRRWRRFRRSEKRRAVEKACADYRASSGRARPPEPEDIGASLLDVAIPARVTFRGKSLDEGERAVLVDAIQGGALEEILRRQLLEGVTALGRCVGPAADTQMSKRSP